MTVRINNFFPGELFPDVTIAGCIDIFENAWPNPEATINMVESEIQKTDSGAYWQQAETMGSGAFQNIRTNKLMLVSHLAHVSNNPALQNVHNQFYMLLLAATATYAKKYQINEGFWHEEYNLLKYDSGEEYKGHYDGGTGTGRSISALVYLNDNYEGGDLEFVHFGIKIKPQKGMLVLFPSNFAYTHIAHPVTSGAKYALVTWIRDRQP
jgi:predicted 2-oxoglutarate/Fe(II)-dependent dioxygenase YbiX